MTRTLSLLLLAGLCTLTASLGISLAVIGTESSTVACPAAHELDARPPVLDAPSSIVAGDGLTVVVAADSRHASLPATIALLRADGPIARSIELRDGLGAATFGPEATAAAGAVRLFASVCGAESSRRLQIRPGEAVAPLDVLVGPRRITADGEGVATAVTLPIDRLGNPVAAGTEVHYELRRADGGRQSASIATDRLVGVLRVEAGRMAGRTTVAATAGSARGAVADLVEEPGPPVEGFELLIEAAPADGAAERQPAVRIEDLRDRSGNRVADGTLVTVVMEGPGLDGARVQGLLVGGAARLPLQAPERAGTFVLQAFVDGVASRPTEYVVAPATDRPAIPLRLVADPALGELRITVGPVLGELGGYAPDGTVATIEVATPDGATISRRTRLADGEATMQLAAPASGRYVVTAETIYGAGTASEVVS